MPIAALPRRPWRAARSVTNSAFLTGFARAVAITATGWFWSSTKNSRLAPEAEDLML